MGSRLLSVRVEAHMSKAVDEFMPGETAPVSGIYDVIHDNLDGDSHAFSNQVTAIAGKIFPPCRGCHEWVRFRLHQAAEHLESHDHFKN